MEATHVVLVIFDVELEREREAARSEKAHVKRANKRWYERDCSMWAGCSLCRGWLEIPFWLLGEFRRVWESLLVSPKIKFCDFLLYCFNKGGEGSGDTGKQRVPVVFALENMWIQQSSAQSKLIILAPSRECFQKYRTSVVLSRNLICWKWKFYQEWTSPGIIM